MTTFWKQLQRLALGQLFNGGYLSAPPASAKPAAKPLPKDRTAEFGNRLPHAQIVACQ